MFATVTAASPSTTMPSSTMKLAKIAAKKMIRYPIPAMTEALLGDISPNEGVIVVGVVIAVVMGSPL